MQALQGCTACTTTSFSHILTGTEQTVMQDDNIGVLYKQSHYFH